jgi:hypothetical protein
MPRHDAWSTVLHRFAPSRTRPQVAHLHKKKARGRRRLERQALDRFISLLFSTLGFDHSKCDAILQFHHVDVINAYGADQAEGWRD